MRNAAVVELSEAAWAGIGAAVSAIGIFGLGMFKAKKESELGMTKEQRLMLESVFNQVQSQASTIDMLNKDVTSQRNYYETKIDELRTAYRAEIAEQELSCQKQLQQLRVEIDRLNRLLF